MKVLHVVRKLCYLSTLSLSCNLRLHLLVSIRDKNTSSKSQCFDVVFVSEKDVISDQLETMQQTSLQQIDLQRIPQKEIREFIRYQIKNQTTSFDKLTSSCRPGDLMTGYHFHEKVYTCNYPVEQLWQHYLTADPRITWNSSMLTFGLMISKQEQTVMYTGDIYAGASVGQVMFVTIEILGGIVKVPVAHEIIDINPEKRYLEVSYVKGGKSEGVQRISFHDNQDKTTRIAHTTYYRSASWFRDKFLYPYFHTLVINKYHDNMIKLLAGQ